MEQRYHGKMTELMSRMLHIIYVYTLNYTQSIIRVVSTSVIDTNDYNILEFY